MAPAANGPSGSSLPLTVLDCSNPASAFARAIDVIEHELAFTQGSVEAVTAACAELRRERDAWPFASTRQHFVSLARLVTKGSSAARAPLVPLLLDVADAIDDPWAICAELLDSRDGWICDATLERMRLLVEAGRLRVDDRLLEGLGRLVETGPDLLREGTALEKIRELWRAPPDDAHAADAALTALYLASAVRLSRRLAARLLDLPSAPPAHEIAVQLLGQPLADYLEPYLAYTRATHLDLLDLAAGSTGALLDSLREAEAVCGAALVREIVSAIGWRSLNGGVTVRPFVAVSVAGSFPLLMTPAEAVILERCPDVRRAFERFVIVAHAAAPWSGEPAPSGTGAIDRFRQYNIRHANLLVDLLDIAPLSSEKVRRMLQAMAAVVEDFEILFGSAHAEECAEITARYRAIAADVERELAGSVPDRPLSASLTRLVQAFEDPATPADICTMHGCKRYLHQRGLQLGSGLAESSRATNRTVTLGLASDSEVLHVLRAIEYAEFEPASDGAIPHVVRAAVDAFARHLLHGERSFPTLRIFCYGNEVHCFAGFRNHPAFIRLDFSPPQRGGMIDLEYFGVSKYDLEWHPNVSLDAIQQIFRALDFDVQVVNTRIHARFDKERAADLRDIADQVQRLFNLVPYLMDVDWVIGDLDLSDEAKHTVAAAWGEFLVRWGVLPMPHALAADRRGILIGTERTAAGDRERRWSGDGSYCDRFTVEAPRTFWATLRAALQADVLGDAASFDGERPIGQSTLDRYLLNPLRMAIARGQVLAGDGRLAAAPPLMYIARHEASVIAEILQSDDETLLRSAVLARFVLRLAGTLRFSPTGTINGYEVQRAVLPLADDVVGLFVLCDGGGIPRLAVFSRGDRMYERGQSAAGAPVPNWSVSVEALATDLRRANVTEGSTESDSCDSRPAAQILRAMFAAPNAWARSAPAEGDRYLRGVRASPGRAVGLARPGLAGRRPADLDGGILIAPALGPRDNPFVFRSAGIVSTGGGVLSHAGLLALQFRKPSLVVSGRWERSTDGAESLVYSCVSHRDVSRQLAGFDVIERHDTTERDECLRDGDLVVLDADGGLLRVIGQERDALALHDGLRQLVAAGRNLATAASDEELLSQRGRLLRARHQLEKLLARIGDPALARFAAAELLVGESGSETRLGHADKVRLLRALFGNALVGTATVATVEELAHALARRDAALAEQATQLVPTSLDPLEVIALRLDVRHSRGLFDTVTGLLAEAGVAPPARGAPQGDSIDSLAAAGCARCAPEFRPCSMRRPHGYVSRHWRHALRQLQRLDDVLDTSAGERESPNRVAERLASGRPHGRAVVLDAVHSWPGRRRHRVVAAGRIEGGEPRRGRTARRRCADPTLVRRDRLRIPRHARPAGRGRHVVAGAVHTPHAARADRSHARPARSVRCPEVTRDWPCMGISAPFRAACRRTGTCLPGTGVGASRAGRGGSSPWPSPIARSWPSGRPLAKRISKGRRVPASSTRSCSSMAWMVSATR